jgi:hypothetical protein
VYAYDWEYDPVFCDDVIGTSLKWWKQIEKFKPDDDGAAVGSKVKFSHFVISTASIMKTGLFYTDVQGQTHEIIPVHEKAALVFPDMAHIQHIIRHTQPIVSTERIVKGAMQIFFQREMQAAKRRKKNK